MPIYEYLCSECEHGFDRLQKISDAPLTTCPECQKDTLQKLVSAPSFRLSGSGWYETDFKSDKDKKKNLAGDAARDKKTSDQSSPDKSAGQKKSSSAANDTGSKAKSSTTKSA